VLVINNGSTDETKKTACTEWQRHAGSVPLRVIDEPTPGKTYALEKGFSLAQYDYVLVCDDDNWLEAQYLQTAYALLESNSAIGILGGQGEAVLTGAVPLWFAMYAGNYAVGRQAPQSGDVTESRGYLWGAGMVFRKILWQQLAEIGFQSLLVDRKGANLSSGGDYEFCAAARLLGYRLYYDERLKFKHFIPDQRLSWDYLRRLRRALGASEAYTRLYGYVLDKRLANGCSAYDSRNVMMADARLLLASARRLYFFLFRSLEGEVYFSNYEYAWGRLTAMVKLWPSHRNLIRKIERTFVGHTSDAQRLENVQNCSAK
jgi:glycosyltransferase involved in cell wall biosynthesis